MADTQIAREGKPAKRASSGELWDFARFLLKVVAAMFVLRTVVVAPFNIPSESMYPNLLVGDYLLATKWNYGVSRYSLPFALPLPHGRLFGTLPNRGDIVVFKAPPSNQTDYIKRVIGLPGDVVALHGGQLILNGVAVPRVARDDLVLAPTDGQPCLGQSGAALCHFPRFQETLPNGVSYDVLDLGPTPADDFAPLRVPAGMLFLMGDNRDNSRDSRFDPSVGGIGLVPLDNLVGRAAIRIFSWDAQADWAHKVRWNRIGSGL